MKILSVIMFFISILSILFALVVHIANNAKGGIPAVYDFKVIAYCLVITVFSFAVSYWAWR